jgi:pimeloyl-ACP methyl ester carboxylesterase
MPLRTYLLAALFLLLTCSLHAQTLELNGHVLDEKSNAPVSFASVGIQNTKLGTVADALGHFRFIAPAPQAPEQSVVISCVGYETQVRPLHEFLGHSPTVRLAPTAVSLAAVTVRPGKVKTKTFGRTSSSTLMGANLYTEPNLIDDGLAKEQGMILPIDAECLLQDFNFHVAFNRFKSVKFRLNLYSVKAGLPNKPLLTQDIRFDVTQPRGWVKVDLRPYHIYLQGHKEVAVTLQWLQSEAIEGSPKAFGVSAVPLPGHSVLTRDKSQAQWQEIKPGYLSFYLTVDSYRSSKQTTQSVSVENSLPDSLQYLRYLMTNLPQLSNPQHYGENAAVGHYVPVQGAKIYYERYGHGEPLLLLHGNSQSISAFQQQIGELAKHYEVIAIDTRAQGKSQDLTSGNLTYDLFAADIRQLLDSLHLRKVHVVGWSDGGNTALKLALHHPAYVNRLVLMGANLFPTAEAIEPDFLQLLQRRLREATKVPETQASQQQVRLLRLLLQEPQMTFQELHTITAPVLVLAGQHDVIREAHTRAIAQHIPKAQLKIFPGASHYAPQEVPQVFNEAVLRFLGQSGLALPH